MPENLFLYFMLLLDIVMKKLKYNVTAPPQGRNRLDYFAYSADHGWWYPDDTINSIIRRHDIDQSPHITLPPRGSFKYKATNIIFVCFNLTLSHRKMHINPQSNRPFSLLGASKIFAGTRSTTTFVPSVRGNKSKPHNQMKRAAWHYKTVSTAMNFLQQSDRSPKVVALFLPLT